MHKEKESTVIDNMAREIIKIQARSELKNLLVPITSTFKVTDDFKSLFASDTLALKALIGLDTPSSSIRTMAEANRSILAMTAANRLADSMAHSMHEMESLRSTFDMPAALSASLVAQSKLFELQKFPLGAEINAAADLQDSLRLNLDGLTANYRRLVDFTNRQSPVIETLRPEIIQYPPYEIFRETELLEQITIPEDEQVVLDEYEVIVIPEEKSLEDWLGKINSGFPSLLQGARAVLNTDNPDRARHVTVSLRELIGRVLHQFAPNNEIKTWSTNPSDYDDKGKPTRRARVLYICRTINCNPLSEFVEADVKSILALIRVRSYAVGFNM